MQKAVLLSTNKIKEQNTNKKTEYENENSYEILPSAVSVDGRDGKCYGTNVHKVETGARSH
jgi:hypothetical protein